MHAHLIPHKWRLQLHDWRESTIVCQRAFTACSAQFSFDVPERGCYSVQIPGVVRVCVCVCVLLVSSECMYLCVCVCAHRQK